MGNLIVVGDDLTGTVDCVSLGVRCGCRVFVTVNPDGEFRLPDPHKKEVLGINIASRTLHGKQAYAIAKEATLKCLDGNDNVILKKMDTGFRGNAPYEIEAMLEALNKKLCFILEHIPSHWTFTLYGHQFSKGALLEKSDFAKDDLLKAPKKSYIPDILAEGTNLPIGTVDIDAVKSGRIIEATREQIESGKRILVFDVLSVEDGHNIVNELMHVYPDVMWAGSTGIVEALLNHLYGTLRKPPVYKTHPHIRTIGFSGTAYKATQSQLNYLQNHSDTVIISLNMDRILSGDTSVYDEVLFEALAVNNDNRDFIICRQVSEALAKKPIAHDIEKALCTIAARVAAKAKYDRILIIGGETSQAIFANLGVSLLDMNDPRFIGCGIGTFANGPYKGKNFIIKGGSIGDEMLLKEILD